MEANDNVVVVSPDGRRLATATLKYDNASNTISTDKQFTFDRGDRASGREQLPLRPGLQERRDRRPRGVAGDGMLLPGQEEK